VVDVPAFDHLRAPNAEPLFVWSAPLLPGVLPYMSGAMYRFACGYTGKRAKGYAVELPSYRATSAAATAARAWIVVVSNTGMGLSS